MKPEGRDPAYLWDMRKYAQDARALVGATSFEELDRDSIRKLALERMIEIIGEAARRVSPDFKRRHPSIDWRALAGQRNVIAHEYGKIDHRRLYDTTCRLVPVLLVELESILRDVE